MKRLLTLALCLVVGFCSTIAVSASTFADTPDAALVEVKEQPIAPMMAYTSNTLTQISIVNGQAICAGSITGYKGTTTKVEITLTLQRKLASSSTWSNYYNHPKQTFNSYSGATSFTKGIDKGYQYRTKAVYTAWAGTKYESFTEYSGAQAY